MAEPEIKSEEMCAHCGKRPARKMYSGPFSPNYCSLECNAIEYYRSYAAITCCFSVGFLLTIYGIFFVLIDEYPIDAWAIFQILFLTYGLLYFGYATVIGFRAAKRENKLEDSNTPITN